MQPRKLISLKRAVYWSGLTEGPRREGNMLWLTGFQWKIANVFWLDCHACGGRVKRRRGSRTLTLRIGVKCGMAIAVPAAPVPTVLR